MFASNQLPCRQRLNIFYETLKHDWHFSIVKQGWRARLLDAIKIGIDLAGGFGFIDAVWSIISTCSDEHDSKNHHLNNLIVFFVDCAYVFLLFILFYKHRNQVIEKQIKPFKAFSEKSLVDQENNDSGSAELQAIRQQNKSQSFGCISLDTMTRINQWMNFISRVMLGVYLGMLITNGENKVDYMTVENGCFDISVFDWAKIVVCAITGGYSYSSDLVECKQRLDKTCDEKVGLIVSDHHASFSRSDGLGDDDKAPTDADYQRMLGDGTDPTVVC